MDYGSTEIEVGQGAKNVGLRQGSGGSNSRELHFAHIARADKKALGIVEESNDKLDEELEDEDLEDSISKTLGDEDTVEEVKRNDRGKQDLMNNRSSNLGFKFDLWNKKAVGDRVKIEAQDVKKVEESWGFGLVGYIAGMISGKPAIFSVCNSWKVKYKVFFHGSGWIIFKFENEADRDKVLDKGPYKVYGKLLLLKVLREMFAFNEDEISKVPVWVKFPNLPFGLWNKSALGKIASCLGKPIQSDNLTQTMQALSYARLLVEVDIAKEARYEIDIDLPNGESMVQKVVYEFLPRFCSKCKCIGHSLNVCGRKSGVKRNKVETSSLPVGSAVAAHASPPSALNVQEDPVSDHVLDASDRPASPEPSRPASPSPPRSASPPRCPGASSSVCPTPSATQGPLLSSAQQLNPPNSRPNLSSSLPEQIIIDSAANVHVLGPIFQYPPIMMPFQSTTLPDQPITETVAKAAPSEENSNVVLESKEMEGNRSGNVKERRKKKKDRKKKKSFAQDTYVCKKYGARPYPEDKRAMYRHLKSNETGWVYVGTHLIEWPKWLKSEGIVCIAPV